MTRRRTLWALVLVAAGVPLGWLSGWESPSRGAPEPPEDVADEPAPTPGVRVALHLDEPIVDGRTVVWTAAFQAAWDALADLVPRRWGVPLDLGPPARAEDLAALEAGRLWPSVVDPRDLTVISGPATEETWAAVDRASDLPRPEGSPPPRADDLLAFARLKASVRYQVPFFVEREPLLFGPRRAPVRAYGLAKDSFGPEADRVREQIDLHVLPREEDEDASKHAVLVLRGRDGRRVVVSGRSPKATLGETWSDVASVVRATEPRGFSAVDHVAIPRVSIRTGRSYDELVGAEVLGVPESEIAVARQDVTLVADERGADVDAEAIVVAVAALPYEIVIDSPFLLALLAAGSDRPFALAWIGGDDALTPWGEGAARPIDGARAATYVGSWSLDRDASIAATRPRAESSGIPGTARSVASRLRHATFDLEVSPAGLATVTEGWDEDSRRRRDPVPLRSDRGRVVLVQVVPGPESAATEPHERRWHVRRDGPTLRLESSGITLVLRRR